MNPAQTYVAELSRYFADPTSSEMSYRTPFQAYLETIFPKSENFHIQHDAKSVEGNKPDFIVSRDGVPLLYIEVKKVGEDLDKIEKSSQAARYFGYTNLIISDYAEFRFFRNGQKYEAEPIKLADIHKSSLSLTPHTENAERLVRTIRDFVSSQKEPIRSGKHLAKIMGGKAQRIRHNLLDILERNANGAEDLTRMMSVIKTHLVTSLTPADFADMYAQTLVYGLFAARYSDTSPDTFSRQEARDLVPATNPFLRHFFDHISGASFPPQLDRIVTELCEVFTHADVKTLMEEYFKQTDLMGQVHEAPDPVIHFYEDFLREYDPGKKMEMGVFYTPLPVVRFIIRGIDSILKTEFGIAKGIADNSKIPLTLTTQNDKGKDVTETKQVHKVQLLDVATGTGTFLNETVLHIHETLKSQQGRWGAYVDSDLLPRLHGFELMMASYTVAHLKLALTLQNTGITEFNQRLGIYLTNTLDEAHDIALQGSLFGFLDSITEESKLASEVKRDYPIMVVMGNPPYSVVSQNLHYTSNDAYKVEPGGLLRLKEDKNFLDDDYVKFIHFAESMVEKNGEGVIGMITNHGYIDNISFRGMRWHLRNTFDSLYVLDLHGNTTKKEVSPDGSVDKNVFDIKTGVSIIFGVKKKIQVGNIKHLAKVYVADIFGSRALKFQSLEYYGGITDVPWVELPEDCEIWKLEGVGKSEYKKGFSIDSLFIKNTTGVFTLGDGFIVANDKEELKQRIENILIDSVSESDLTVKFNLGKNYAKWVLENKVKNKINDYEDLLTELHYRPFDRRYTTLNSGLVWRPRISIMKHLLNSKNLALLFSRQGGAANPKEFDTVFISASPVDLNFFRRGGEVVCPLYLFADDGSKVANLDSKIVAVIQAIVGETTPENILDYVYTVLHSPSYRTTYAEFLKADFPRVPYPTDKETFWQLVPLGTKLRNLHLLTDSVVHNPITTFPISGSNIVEKISHLGTRVMINETQYWDGISEAVWNFYIGGYQPAQKYLKDRKGRVLTNAEFENYEQMIVSLSETIKVMAEIDMIKLV